MPSHDKRVYNQLFAKGYNDLILRSYDELPAWKNYLCDNPRRLMMKRANPNNLRPFFDLRIGSHIYNGIGNRQKCVMRTAFNAGLPTIVLLENGFTPLSKPHGEQFYACAKGHLLGKPQNFP